jgi:hypothetical protein
VLKLKGSSAFLVGILLCDLTYLGLGSVHAASSGTTSSNSGRSQQKSRALPRLDTAAIRKNYLEGEFTRVSDSLEAWRMNGLIGSHADSVFTYRHLGIVYASNEVTHNRAESYLNLLLGLEPNIDMLDPYVSTTVEAFWDKVKARNAKVKGVATPSSTSAVTNTANKHSNTTSDNTTVRSKDGFPWLWTAAGTVLVGGAVAFYFISQEQPATVAANPTEASLDTAIIYIKVPKQP